MGIAVYDEEYVDVIDHSVVQYIRDSLHSRASTQCRYDLPKTTDFSRSSCLKVTNKHSVTLIRSVVDGNLVPTRMSLVWGGYWDMSKVASSSVRRLKWLYRILLTCLLS